MMMVSNLYNGFEFSVPNISFGIEMLLYPFFILLHTYPPGIGINSTLQIETWNLDP